MTKTNTRRRIVSVLLALVMLLGMFSGCSKNGSETTDPANPSNNPGTKTETNDEKAASTSKYAYQAEYLPIPDNVQYVNTSTISGSNRSLFRRRGHRCVSVWRATARSVFTMKTA